MPRADQIDLMRYPDEAYRRDQALMSWNKEYRKVGELLEKA